MGISVVEGGLVYEDKGYVIKLGSLLLPIPLHFLVGRSHIEEFSKINSPNNIDMRFVMNHTWFGFAFSYMGFFNISK